MESDVLKEAVLKVVNYLDERGWCQYDYQDKDGRHCLLGAADRTLTITEKSSLIRSLYSDIAEEMGISEWNDAPGRTYSEVRELLMSLAE